MWKKLAKSPILFKHCRWNLWSKFKTTWGSFECKSNFHFQFVYAQVFFDNVRISDGIRRLNTLLKWKIDEWLSRSINYDFFGIQALILLLMGPQWKLNSNPIVSWRQRRVLQWRVGLEMQNVAERIFEAENVDINSTVIT